MQQAAERTDGFAQGLITGAVITALAAIAGCVLSVKVKATSQQEAPREEFP